MSYIDRQIESHLGAKKSNFVASNMFQSPQNNLYAYFRNVPNTQEYKCKLYQNASKTGMESRKKSFFYWTVR